MDEIEAANSVEPPTQASGESPSGGKKPKGPIALHLQAVLEQRHASGSTNAEALAEKWLAMALEGNTVALKEILLRFAPVESNEAETVTYVYERSADGDWHGPDE